MVPVFPLLTGGESPQPEDDSMAKIEKTEKNLKRQLKDGREEYWLGKD
jgi:hypothetical protein